MARKLKSENVEKNVPSNFASSARKRKPKVEAAVYDGEYESVLSDPVLDDVDPEEEDSDDDLSDDDDELEMGKKTKKKTRKPKTPKPVKHPKELAEDTIKFPFDLGYKLLLDGTHAVRSFHRLTAEEIPSAFITGQKQITEHVAGFLKKHPKQAAKLQDFVNKFASHEISLGNAPGSEWEYHWFVTEDKQFNLYVGIHPHAKGLSTKKLLSLFAKG